MAGDPYIAAIEAELAYWPGATIKWSRHRKHRKLLIVWNGQERWTTLPTTSSDNVRGPKNNVANLRRTLTQMGAKRRDAVPISKREQQEEKINMAENAPVRMGITDVITVVIPKTNPLYERFADKNDKPTGHWALELRSNPAPGNNEPFIAIVKKTIPPGKKRINGMVGGTYNKQNHAFQLTIAPGTVSHIVKRFGQFRTTAVEVSQEPGGVILKLPTDRKEPILRGDKRLEKLTAPPPAPEPVIEPEPERPHAEVPAPVGIDVLAQLLGQMKTPDKMMLQLPERPLTVERCINFINQRVQSRGKNNLRLLLDQETGMISYIEKGGPAY